MTSLTTRTAWRRALLAALVASAALAPAAAGATTLYPATVEAATGFGQGPSLAIGADGNPVIAHRVDGGGLRFVHCNDALCRGGDEDGVVLDAVWDTGLDPMTAIGAGGTPVIGYFRSGPGDLRIATCDDVACGGTGEEAHDVDAASWASNGGSMAIGADGFPVFSYGDINSYDLRVAKCDDPACTGGGEVLTTVDAAGFTGVDSSLALAAGDIPVIAYQDLSSGDLRVARCNDPACAGGDETITTVDATGATGGTPSIAIGGGGRPVIAYHDVTNGDLRVARCNDPACSGGDETITTVDAAGDVGIAPSIGIRASGNPVIAEYDGTNRDLRLVECNDPACAGGDETISVVDSAGSVGLTPSLALRPDGTPVVAYRDATHEAVRVAAANARASAPAGALAFGSQGVADGPAATRTLTVSGGGITPVTLGTPAITGPGAAAFAITATTCTGATLAPAQTCDVTVAFDPSAEGAATATLSVPGDDPTGPLQRDLTGTGTVPAPPAPPPDAAPPADPGPQDTAPEAPRLVTFRVARGAVLLGVAGADAVTVEVSARARGRELARRLGRCDRMRPGIARERCEDGARWRRVRSGRLVPRDGSARMSLGPLPAGPYRVEVTLTGTGGTITRVRTLRVP